jgi:hypothetical protein
MVGAGFAQAGAGSGTRQQQDSFAAGCTLTAAYYSLDAATTCNPQTARSAYAAARLLHCQHSVRAMPVLKCVPQAIIPILISIVWRCTGWFLSGCA